MEKRLGFQGCHRLDFSSLLFGIVMGVVLGLVTSVINPEIIAYEPYQEALQIQQISVDITLEVCEPEIVQAPVEPVYHEMSVPNNNSNKTYMDADCITCKSSDAYKFKSNYTLSNEGIWVVDGRYCAALGSYYTTTIGTKFDVVLESGEIIKCVLADCKANEHTDSTNRQNPNGSIVEFVVNTSSLPTLAKRMGDLSYINEHFSGEIKSIRVYE